MGKRSMNVTPIRHEQHGEIVQGFVMKNADFKPKKILRWHVIAGLCLIHGFRRGAELGVSQGRFTMFLCSVMHDMTMKCFDLWSEQPDNATETYEGWKHDENFIRFSAIAEQYFPGRIDIHRMDTAQGAALVEDNSLDFVFIDGDHSYEGCKRDIAAWSPKVRKGGMITGHDYHAQKWPGVVKAVDEAFSKKLVAADMVWVVFKQ